MDHNCRESASLANPLEFTAATVSRYSLANLSIKSSTGAALWGLQILQTVQGSFCPLFYFSRLQNFQFWNILHSSLLEGSATPAEGISYFSCFEWYMYLMSLSTPHVSLYIASWIEMSFSGLSGKYTLNKHLWKFFAYTFWIAKHSVAKLWPLLLLQSDFEYW